MYAIRRVKRQVFPMCSVCWAPCEQACMHVCMYTYESVKKQVFPCTPPPHCIYRLSLMCFIYYTTKVCRSNHVHWWYVRKHGNACPDCVIVIKQCMNHTDRVYYAIRWFPYANSWFYAVWKHSFIFGDWRPYGAHVWSPQNTHHDQQACVTLQVSWWLQQTRHVWSIQHDRTCGAKILLRTPWTFPC